MYSFYSFLECWIQLDARIHSVLAWLDLNRVLKKEEIEKLTVNLSLWYSMCIPTHFFLCVFHSIVYFVIPIVHGALVHGPSRVLDSRFLILDLSYNWRYLYWQKFMYATYITYGSKATCMYLLCLLITNTHCSDVHSTLQILRIFPLHPTCTT